MQSVRVCAWLPMQVSVRALVARGPCGHCNAAAAHFTSASPVPLCLSERNRFAFPRCPPELEIAPHFGSFLIQPARKHVHAHFGETTACRRRRSRLETASAGPGKLLCRCASRPARPWRQTHVRTCAAFASVTATASPHVQALLAGAHHNAVKLAHASRGGIKKY